MSPGNKRVGPASTEPTHKSACAPPATTQLHVSGSTGARLTAERITVAKWKYALLEADLSLREKYTALVMAVRMDKTGETFVGLERIAKDSGQSKPTVKKYVDALEEKGWLIRVKRGNGYAAHSFAASPTGLPQDETGPPVQSGHQPVSFERKPVYPRTKPELQNSKNSKLEDFIPTLEAFEQLNRELEAVG